ncbi:MAG TPA: hypothetical protein VJS30_03770 [Paraburkholderia sp.]|nr:hypothetical protein [Paraburkholderia sp.]
MKPKFVRIVAPCVAAMADMVDTIDMADAAHFRFVESGLAFKAAHRGNR